MSLYADFTAAVDQALAALHACNRGFSHGPHDLDTGHRCPGYHNPTLPTDQTRHLTNQVRQHINTNQE